MNKWDLTIYPTQFHLNTMNGIQPSTQPTTLLDITPIKVPVLQTNLANYMGHQPVMNPKLCWIAAGDSAWF